MSDTEPSKSKAWYSIKEAAEYLDVGEPTIYRWMRDGKITYRKVGDSTRFWREDLDAVMEVFPSDKDLEKVQTFCPVCHHSEMVEGRVQSTGLNYFRPKKIKFWTLKDTNIETRGMMCKRCGAILWFGDVTKLNVVKTETGKKATTAPQETMPTEKAPEPATD
jgi:excisionase family DNA binding protein